MCSATVGLLFTDLMVERLDEASRSGIQWRYFVCHSADAQLASRRICQCGDGFKLVGSAL